MPYRNIRLNPILRLIYLLLRFTAWAGLNVYYRRRLVLGRPNLRFDGPAIVISNHPSTLTDVLNVGLSIRQEMFFLANYSLFRNPVSNWLLTRLYCIPVKRKEDVADGEDRNNDAAFEQSYLHLEQYGVLYIAAEGVSWMNRFIRPLKTGTARIAFGMEARNGWKSEMKIIPVGLTYNRPNFFRSEVVVNAGEPVYARDWAEAWAKDPETAVDILTQHLENQLKGLTIHTRDDAGEQFITRLETMLQQERPLPQEQAFYRSQQLTAKFLDDAVLRERTNAYFDQLAQHGLSEQGLAAFTAPDAGPKTLSDGLRLALGLPFFMVGYGFWFLPCYLPGLVAKKLKLYIGYDSNVKILVGLFTFPPMLWGAWRLAMHYLADGWQALGVVLLFIALGFYAERYLDVLRRVRERQKVAVLARKQADMVKELEKMRRECVRLLA